MTLHFFYSLTTTQIPNFGYIKWTPYVALTSSFLNTGFDQYVRQGMGRKMPPNTWNEFVVASFPSEILLMSIS